MKNAITAFVYGMFLVLSSVLLTSCQAIGDIFSAGVYVGIFLVIAVILVIVLLVARIGKK